MPVVANVDYPNRRIYLSADTLGVSVQPIDVYKEVRELRRITPDHRKFFPLISARGNEAVGPTNTPILTILANGARIVPFDASHTLTVGGSIVSVEENLAGPDLFDRSPLSASTDVDISYRPPQVEVIEVEKPTAATEIADAVWQQIMQTGITSQQMMNLLYAHTLNGGGTATADHTHDEDGSVASILGTLAETSIAGLIEGPVANSIAGSVSDAIDNRGVSGAVPEAITARICCA